MRNYHEIDYRGAVVYSIVNSINGKRYVGSCVHLNKRKNKHRWTLTTHHKEAPVKLQRAWDKYGVDNFSIIILQYCKRSKRELKRYEQMWIDFYDSCKSGYNALPKAYTHKGVKRYKSTGKKIRAWNLGRTASVEARNNMSLSHLGTFGSKCGRSKPVAQYDLSGKLIAEFDCARDAQRKIGFDFKNISACCKGLRPHHKNYIFIFSQKNKKKQQKKADAIVELLRNYVNPACKKVAQYDFSGKLIKMWDGVIEATKNSFTHSGVVRCCRGRVNHHKGYVWFYWDDIKNIKKSKLMKIIKKKTGKVYMIKKVAQCDMSGKPVKIWDSKQDITDKLKVPYGGLSECCKGRRESYRDYRWKYADNIPLAIAS